MKRALLLGLSAFALLACGSGGEAKSSGRDKSDSLALDVAMKTEQLTLPNGLVVVFHQEPTARSVYVHVRYHVGSKDDPEGRAGFAHLFEHLMFRGGKHVGETGSSASAASGKAGELEGGSLRAPSNEKSFASWVEGVGGTFNGTTQSDSTDYFEEAPAAQLPLLLWLESDRMAYPAAGIPEDGFAAEREVVKNEHRERRENVAYGNVFRIARGAIFGPKHPYGREGELGDDQLDKSTVAEARAFASRYYRPNNATLVVCGAFDPKAAKDLVQKYFATIPPGPPLAPLEVAPPVLAASKRIEVAANVEQSMVAVAWPAPATEADGYPELAMGLATFEGALATRLVGEKRLADSVDGHYDAARLGGLVVVQVKLRKDAAPDAVLSDVDLYLRKLSELGRVGRWTGFADFKTRALVSQVVNLESLAPRANRILHGLEYHRTPDSVELDLKRIDAVASSDVGSAIEHFMKDAPRVVVVVTPDKSAPRAGRVR